MHHVLAGGGVYVTCTLGCGLGDYYSMYASGLDLFMVMSTILFVTTLWGGVGWVY